MNHPEHSTNSEDGFDFATVVGCDPGVPLLVQCDEVVRVISAVNAGDGPYNRAEAQGLPEAEQEVALREQRAIIRRIECLCRHITDEAVTDESTEKAMRECNAKVCVLDALSSVASWDREALVALRVSISRDQAAIQQRLAVTAHRTSRPSWIGRLTAVW